MRGSSFRPGPYQRKLQPRHVNACDAKVASARPCKAPRVLLVVSCGFHVFRFFLSFSSDCSRMRDSAPAAGPFDRARALGESPGHRPESGAMFPGASATVGELERTHRHASEAAGVANPAALPKGTDPDPLTGMSSCRSAVRLLKAHTYLHISRTAPDIPTMWVWGGVQNAEGRGGMGLRRHCAAELCNSLRKHMKNALC